MCKCLERVYVRTRGSTQMNLCKARKVTRLRDHGALKWRSSSRRRMILPPSTYCILFHKNPLATFYLPTRVSMPIQNESPVKIESRKNRQMIPHEMTDFAADDLYNASQSQHLHSQPFIHSVLSSGSLPQQPSASEGPPDPGHEDNICCPPPLDHGLYLLTLPYTSLVFSWDPEIDRQKDLDL